MFSPSPQVRIWLLIAISLLAEAATAQKGGGGGGGGGNTTRSAPRLPPPTDTNNLQPLFISGRVVLDGGQSLPEPVAIERVCNGASRREGYTDFKGHFQLQLGTQAYGFQDASENDSRSSLTISDRRTMQSETCYALTRQGCEIRAVLPGFQSSAVALRTSECDSFEMNLGTIVLKRLGDVKGSAISVTSIAAPKDARQAYEKGSKAFSQDKLPEAERELEKAVHIYPNFAAAWSRLGDVLQREENVAGARTAYNQALQEDPQYVNPLFGLALIAIAEKNWEQAADFTAKVGSLNAYAFPTALFYNAAANFNQGKLEAAEESAKKYRTFDGEHRHPEVSLLLSSILARKQDFAGAAQQIRDYLAIVPNATNMAELQARAKSYEEMSVSKTRQAPAQ